MKTKTIIWLVIISILVTVDFSLIFFNTGFWRGFYIFGTMMGVTVLIIKIIEEYHKI